MPLQATEESTVIDELLDFLARPSAYPHKTQRVEMKETHISWVFVTDRFAYKLKKPVRFDFLDFSTLERRHRACQDELRLNRRISPSVYLDVVPVSRTPQGRLVLEQERQVIDWLVKMRRLDDDRTLLARLTDHPIDDRTRAVTQTVATYLANFYARQAPLTVRTSDFQDHLRHHIEDNEQQLLRLAETDDERDAIRLIHAAQRRFLITHRDVFDDRVRDGRIVDGHGDLRPEHVYLYRQPLIIDCIEFSAEYRENDIVDELAFLAMECDRLGGSFVGEQLFAAYVRASGEQPPSALIAFYKSYRACVRAKVAALRSEQQLPAAAVSTRRVEQAYVDLARRYVQELGPRVVMVVGGLMGSGKSTLARQFSQLLAGETVSTDKVRQQQPRPPEAAQPSYGQGAYSQAARLGNYQALMSVAREAFRRTNLVILDGTFCSQRARRLACQLAAEYQAKILQIQCECPREVALTRIADRLQWGQSASEARPEFYDRQAAEAEPPLANVPLVRIDTTTPFPRQQQHVLESLQTVCRSDSQSQ